MFTTNICISLITVDMINGMLCRALLMAAEARERWVKSVKPVGEPRGTLPFREEEAQDTVTESTADEVGLPERTDWNY